MKKSVNARLEYARLKNESPAIALLEKQSKKKQQKSKVESKNVQSTNIDESAENSNVANDQVYANCVCTRGPATLRCTNCGLLSYGRVVENCQLHRNVTFLMDFIYCPHCMASKEHLQGIELNARACQTLNDQMLNALRNFGTKPERKIREEEEEDEVEDEDEL